MLSPEISGTYAEKNFRPISTEKLNLYRIIMSKQNLFNLESFHDEFNHEEPFIKDDHSIVAKKKYIIL